MVSTRLSARDALRRGAGRQKREVRLRSAGSLAACAARAQRIKLVHDTRRRPQFFSGRGAGKSRVTISFLGGRRLIH